MFIRCDLKSMTETDRELLFRLNNYDKFQR